MQARFPLAMLLLTALAAPVCAQGSAEYGKEEFESKCSKCHAVDATAGAGTGPNLHGIIGTAAGSRAGFVFSDAMKAAGVTWSEESLARFLQNPGTVVPGNKMAASFTGTTAEISTDIAAYLKSVP
jgi:cytochrome c